MKVSGGYSVILLVFLSCILSSCLHRDLVEPSYMHYVRIYADQEIRNVSTGIYNPSHTNPVTYRQPEIMHVLLYDDNGKLASERYLRNVGNDERGVYYDGIIQCPEGHYRILAYNFGTEATIVSEQRSLSGLEARTDLVTFSTAGRGRSELTDAPEIHQPDHLLVLNDEVELARNPVLDTLKGLHSDFFLAQSVVKTYYLQIKLKGIQYVNSVAGYLTGTSRRISLADNALDSSPHCISFDFYEDGEFPGLASDEVMLYTSFSTFGVLREQTKVRDRSRNVSYTDGKTELVISILAIDGKVYEAVVDITPEFEKPLAVEKQWLLLDHLLVNAPEPTGGGSGGGFNPGVEKWDEVSIDIFI